MHMFCHTQNEKCLNNVNGGESLKSTIILPRLKKINAASCRKKSEQKDIKFLYQNSILLKLIKLSTRN